MLQELEDLSNAIDYITEGEARNLITHVNTRLRDVLNANIIDVMYREEARDNDIILRPLSSVVAPGGRDEAAPWAINSESLGVWPKAFFAGSTIWLENIIASRGENKEVNNNFAGTNVSSVSVRDLNEIYHDTDSILCIPLIIDHSAIGVFCIELAGSEIINSKTVTFLKRLASSYACLTWQVFASKISNKHTTKAINHFKTSVTKTKIREYISHSSRGVLVRPFGDTFNTIGDLVAGSFDVLDLELHHFIASPGATVMDQLKDEIKLSPFGVVDITDLNPNVLIELGMMKVLEKDIMLLRNTDDGGELPFDIKPDQVDRYELRGNEAHIIETGTGRLIPLDSRVTSFVDKLKAKGLIS